MDAKKKKKGKKDMVVMTLPITSQKWCGINNKIDTYSREQYNPSKAIVPIQATGN